MKVILKDDIYLDNISKNKEYEIITILFIKWETSEKTYDIIYYIINDNYEISFASESDFIIIDSKLELDFIYEQKVFVQRYTTKEQRIPSYVLYPKSVDIRCLYNALEYTEPIEMDKSFCERFKHLLPEYKYAECFKERYQDPDIDLIAEEIGDNWVLCPECNEAFEVDKNQGVVYCPNVACKAILNNPYAPVRPLKPK